MKKILFIAEKSILQSAICYGNDINLLLELLKINQEIYLSNPEDIILSKHNNLTKSRKITIAKSDKIIEIKHNSYLKSALFMLFSLPLSAKLKENSLIKDFLNIDEIEINKSNFDLIIDRSEPISRTKEYYNSLPQNPNYFDDPIFRQIENDKEIVLKIDDELQKKQQKQLGFKTKIIDFKTENKNITDKNRHKLYQLFSNIKNDYSLENILSNFQDLEQIEKNSIISIIEKIFNFKIEFDYFCIKPSNWYGGVAIELIGDKKNQIKQNLSQIDLFYHIAKIQKNILEDVKKSNENPDVILKRAILDGIIIQEQVCYPKFGDLRIFSSFGKIQGVVLRVPAKNKNIANMAAGGHAELFINPIDKTKKELDILKNELKNLGQEDIFIAIMELMENIQNALETKIGKNLKKSAFIGFDALLDENNGKKRFHCNEINLSSAMGQNQIEIANLLEDILKINDYYALLIENINNISSSKEFNSAFARFLIFQKNIEDLSDQDKIKIIDQIYLQIKDINFNIGSIANYTINKIING
jgi:hypothetical protein